MARQQPKNAGMDKQSKTHPKCRFLSGKRWLDRNYHEEDSIVKPDELEKYIEEPPDDVDSDILDRVHGSMIGMALGDALGAHVEFRPHQYLVQNPVTDLKGGGTWGLKKGQFTDDTSMALCLANSLIARRDFVPYDQLVRYKWWYRNGYMSSTGKCFDIGAATRQSLNKFEGRQKEFAKKHDIPINEVDFLSDAQSLDEFDVDCSEDGVAGNGALMRLAPVPLFFYNKPAYAVKCSGRSGEITHGDVKAYDACRYYGALIVAAVTGETREHLLSKTFYEKHIEWFDSKPLHKDIMEIAHGSFKKGGHEKGIRGKGYIVKALEAALWAFWSDEESFEKGALAAVNLGEDTDTTAAIYGQLAGAYYGFKKLPKEWVKQVYAKNYIECMSKWLVYEGDRWTPDKSPDLSPYPVGIHPPSDDNIDASYEQKTNPKAQSVPDKNRKDGLKPPDFTLTSPASTNSDKNGKGRRASLVEPASTLKPGSDKQTGHARAKSGTHVDPTSLAPRIYLHEKMKSCEDVCRWLNSLGVDYETYTDIFEKYNVDAYWLLNVVDNETLKKYGIQSEEHRQFMLDNIQQLQKECSVRFASEKQ